MSILKNLEKAHAAVVVDTLKGSPLLLGKKLGNLAMTAIEEGIKSDAWREYMKHFANNETELARLTTPELDGEKDYLPQFRAYIVSNALCDAGTDTNTPIRVTEDIDKDFTAADMEEDEAFIASRKIHIPDMRNCP